MKQILFKTSLVFLIALIFLSLFPGIITTHKVMDQNSNAILTLPSATHLLGTDSLGRDLTARLLQGAQISLIISLLATAISLGIGTLWGMLAGYGPTWLGQILMRIVDILYAVPDLLFYILLGLFLGRNITGMIIALSSLSWLAAARITRQETLKIKQNEFIQAAKAMGFSNWRIALRHILPQLREVLITTTILKIPSLIILESTLSFIGLGLAPPNASFGTLTREGYEAYLFYPHLFLPPALLMFLVVFSFYQIGDKLKYSTMPH